MSEMVSKVSAALLAFFEKVAERDWGDTEEAPNIKIDGRFNLDELARTALQAMRDPTEAMVANMPWGAATDWRDMINAALDEKEGS